MPEVSTKVDLCQGHDACAPRPFASFSENVFAETFEVARETDQLQSHGCNQHVPHGAAVTQGYPTVTVNGHPIAYIGAAVSCPSGVVATGRPSVFVGEGGRTARAAGHALPATTGEGAPSNTVQRLIEQMRRPLTPTEGECRGKPLYQQAMQKSCMVVAMRMIIHDRTGQKLSEDDVTRLARKTEMVDPTSGESHGAVYHPLNGSFNDGAAGVLGQAGVTAHTLATPDPVTPEYIQRITHDSTQPAILGVELDGGAHSVVVDGIDKDGNVLVRDPWPDGKAGCQRIPFKQFQSTVRSDISTTVLGAAPPGTPPPAYLTRPKQ